MAMMASTSIRLWSGRASPPGTARQFCSRLRTRQTGLSLGSGKFPTEFSKCPVVRSVQSSNPCGDGVLADNEDRTRKEGELPRRENDCSRGDNTDTLSKIISSFTGLAPRVLLLTSLIFLQSLVLTSHPALAKAHGQQVISEETLKAVSSSSPSLTISAIGQNSIFLASLIAWAMAQSLKVVTKFFSERVFDWRMLFASGGMPSSHTSMCCALTASVAVLFGFSSPLFPICLAFALIVMYDATSVRYHAGVQAKVLNVVVAEMLQGHPVSEQKLKEILGHTPLQVCGGAVLGVAVAVLYHIKMGLL